MKEMSEIQRCRDARSLSTRHPPFADKSPTKETMTLKLLHSVQTLVFALVFTALNGAAFASETDETPNPVPVKKHRAKPAKRSTQSDSYLYGSSETQKMRDKRLSRECKGAANGGACRGYTQ